MAIKLIRTQHYGLEVYRLYYGGSLVSEFLSECQARTAMSQLKKKIGIK
jgi:hypothetical protein